MARTELVAKQWVPQTSLALQVGLLRHTLANCSLQSGLCLIACTAIVGNLSLQFWSHRWLDLRRNLLSEPIASHAAVATTWVSPFVSRLYCYAGWRKRGTLSDDAFEQTSNAHSAADSESTTKPSNVLYAIAESLWCWIRPGRSPARWILWRSSRSPWQRGVTAELRGKAVLP